ncbi:MAG: transcription antitermination factor NusB [Simkania negevensis]|nr:transcription antitermination factor NusB [Simkania negevensis]
MAAPQRKFREIIFQILFSSSFNQEGEVREIFPLFHGSFITKKTLFLAHERALLVQKEREEIDRLIKECSVGYDFDRIGLVEKNVLRLALYEILHDKQIPLKVAIAEAIRLSRKFGTLESSSYVHAILDGIVQAKKGERIDGDRISLEEGSSLT